MPEKKYGYTDDHLIRTVARRNQNGDQFATTGWRWLGTKSTSHGGTSITPKDDPEYVTDYRIAVYHILKEQHGIDVTDLPKGAKNWIDNKIREFYVNFKSGKVSKTYVINEKNHYFKRKIS